MRPSKRKKSPPQTIKRRRSGPHTKLTGKRTRPGQKPPEAEVMAMMQILSTSERVLIFLIRHYDDRKLYAINLSIIDEPAVPYNIRFFGIINSARTEKEWWARAKGIVTPMKKVGGIRTFGYKTPQSIYKWWIKAQQLIRSHERGEHYPKIDGEEFHIRYDRKKGNLHRRQIYNVFAPSDVAFSSVPDKWLYR